MDVPRVGTEPWSPPVPFANSGASIVQGLECQVKKFEPSAAAEACALASDLYHPGPAWVRGAVMVPGRCCHR